jgi:3-hydroxyisobutyrate dehydrogenase
VSAPEIGFIGLGNLGFAICCGFATAGAKIVAYDAHPRPDRVEKLRDLGVRLVGTASEAVSGKPFVVTVLPDSDVVESVLMDRSVTEGLREGAVCVEMTSGFPSATIRMARALRERNVRLVDAPICNGGVPAAHEHRLLLCVGGDEEAVEAVRPVLSLVASNVIHAGPLGSGHLVKLLSNSVGGACQVVVSEGLALGEAFGIDPHRLVETLQQCALGRMNFEGFARGYLDPPQRGDVGMKLYLATKDLRNSTMLAGELGSPHGATDAAHASLEIAERLLGPDIENYGAIGVMLRQLGSRARAGRGSARRKLGSAPCG